MLRDTVSVRTRGQRPKAGSWSALESDSRAVGYVFHLFLDGMVRKEGGCDRTLQPCI